MYIPISDLAKLRRLPWSRIRAGREEGVRLTYTHSGTEYTITVMASGPIRITSPAVVTGEPYTIAYEPKDLKLLSSLIFGFAVINPDPTEIGDIYQPNRYTDSVQTILRHILNLISDAHDLDQ